jgi:hypothetical protein
MRRRRGLLLALVLAVAVVALLGRADGTSQAAPQALLLDPVGTFDQPTYPSSPPGDTQRLFVVQKQGQIKLVLNGVIQATPFLDATSWVRSTGQEQGLFSIAFPPDYATSGRFYIDYTAASTGAMTVDEVQRDPTNPNLADPNTRRNVITVPHPSFTNHNGGQLQFGPDGMLYVGTGDGGGFGDPFGSSQNLGDLRGKLLRIDPRQDGGNPYRVPPNNPFVGLQGAHPEIWSYGLRNPWRFSFDRITGDLNIGDVGQDNWEEIDYQPVDLSWGAGGNFGWSCYEGRHVFAACDPPPANPIWPVFEYAHGDPNHGGWVLGHRRLRRPRHRAAPARRAIRLRRLLQQRHLVPGSRASRLPERHLHRPEHPAALVIRRRRLWPRVRDGRDGRDLGQRLQAPTDRPTSARLRSGLPVADCRFSQPRSGRARRSTCRTRTATT